MTGNSFFWMKSVTKCLQLNQALPVCCSPKDPPHTKNKTKKKTKNRKKVKKRFELTSHLSNICS